MIQSKKLFYIILFFFIGSSLFIYTVYTNYSSEIILLKKEKKVIDKIDIYHKLDLYLKEKRGLEQINSQKTKNQILNLEKKIFSLLKNLNNSKINSEINSAFKRVYKNKQKLFYEKTINIIVRFLLADAIKC